MQGEDDLHAGERRDRTSATRAAKVSLTMIVRDEEKNLPHCSGVGAGVVR